MGRSNNILNRAKLDRELCHLKKFASHRGRLTNRINDKNIKYGSPLFLIIIIYYKAIETKNTIFHLTEKFFVTYLFFFTFF